jgi:AraC-like DNA-binding protein
MDKLFKQKYPVNNITLKSFIDNYFVVGYSPILRNIESPDLVPPTGTIVVHFGIGNNRFAYDQLINTNKITVLGLQTQHIKVIPQPGIEIIGVNFKHYGFFNLFDIPASKITNSVLKATEIWKQNDVEYIQNKLSQVYNVEEGIYLIEKFLWSQRKKSKYSLYFDTIAEKIVETHGITGEALFPSKNISRRSFERYFIQTIGCSPKRFANLQRHIYILEKMLTVSDLSLSQLVDLGQYYDFSHLYKDFKMHTGLTCKDYLGINPEFARILYS